MVCWSNSLCSAIKLGCLCRCRLALVFSSRVCADYVRELSDAVSAGVDMLNRNGCDCGLRCDCGTGVCDGCVCSCCATARCRCCSSSMYCVMTFVGVSRCCASDNAIMDLSLSVNGRSSRCWSASWCCFFFLNRKTQRDLAAQARGATPALLYSILIRPRAQISRSVLA